MPFRLSAIESPFQDRKLSLRVLNPRDRKYEKLAIPPTREYMTIKMWEELLSSATTERVETKNSLDNL
jgi:hypothetical protein